MTRIERDGGMSRRAAWAWLLYISFSLSWFWVQWPCFKAVAAVTVHLAQSAIALSGAVRE
jgi:hypothetical protein